MRAGTQESLVPAVEQHAVAAGHEQGIGDGGAVARAGLRPGQPFFEARQGQHRLRPAAVGVAHGKTHQNVRSAVVSLDLIGVKLLRGRIDIPQVRLSAPVQQILRRGGADRGCPRASRSCHRPRPP